MHKLIIIRGHSGSGKTTFALKKIAEFKRQYPVGHVFHIENDHYLIENDKYIWTEQRFRQARLQAQKNIYRAFRFCRKHNAPDCLIVISNVGVNKQEIQCFVHQAEKQNMQVEIYRLRHFYPNIHHVPEDTVMSMYRHLCANPIEGEIIID